MGDRLACAFPCLSLWYEPSWGVDYAMRKNVSDVSVDVSDVSEAPYLNLNFKYIQI